VASEDSAIHAIWHDVPIENIKAGRSLRICPTSKDVFIEKLWLPEKSVCFFEFVYFADHRSHIDGISVANVRNECGKILADEDMAHPYPGMSQADIVMPVPESAKISGNGYVDRRGLRRVDGILRNPDVGRTFISPAQREEMADLKYDIDPDLVRGKSIVLIDDSLVRGTTMLRLVKRLRECGAAQIHLRLASPPILSPCFYGIDFPTIQELLARKFMDGTLHEGDVLPLDVLSAIAQYLGVDSIRYLPVSAIPRALGRSKETTCMACVTGGYPTKNGQRLATGCPCHSS
jgi:amidophosphoribosyltransferase